MKKPVKPKKPSKHIFPPQEKSYSAKHYWGANYNGYCSEDPVEIALDTWDGESDPEAHWKQCSLFTEGYISLEDAIKIANDKNIPLNEVYFGLFVDEGSIGCSVFSIEEIDNGYYAEMVREAEYQEKEYNREMEAYERQMTQYEKDMKEYPLKLKQYLEQQKLDAEQKLRELERNDE